MNEYLSPEEIGGILKCSPITVRLWCRQGSLPFSKFGRLIRVKSKDFQKFCEENEV